MNTTETAQITWEQIPRITKMRLAAHTPVAHDDGLHFQTKNFRGQRVRVELNIFDYYNIEVYKINKQGEKVTVMGLVENVDASQMVQIIEGAF